MGTTPPRGGGGVGSKVAKLASVEQKQIIVDGEALDLGPHTGDPRVLQAIAILGAASAAARDAKKQQAEAAPATETQATGGDEDMGVGNASKRKQPPDNPTDADGEELGNEMVYEAGTGKEPAGSKPDLTGKLTDACAQVAARLTGQAAQRLQGKPARRTDGHGRMAEPGQR